MLTHVASQIRKRPGTQLFHLVAFRHRSQDLSVRAWTVSLMQKGRFERRRLGRNGEVCAEAARQRVLADYVHRHPAFASMRNTD